MSVESRATDPGRRRRIPVRAFSLMVAIALVLAACSGSGVPSPTAAPSTPGASSTAVPQSAAPTAADSSITLYTSVTQNTVDAVVSLWTAANPGFTVEVFRAPTAEVAARIATDLQSGGIQADVLWMTDPLSIQAYADQGLLQAWDPPNAATIDPQYRTSTYFGTRLLNMVMVKGADVTPGPVDWADLTSPEYKDAVAMPDPGFAGSAYAALGYFSQAEGYGTDFYQALKDNGTIQVKTPDEVTTGVAEGRFKVGMTLDSSARTAIAKGSPITMVWPSSGAIAIYSPIAAVDASANREAADSFVDFTLSAEGQDAIGGTGWQPVVGTAGPQPEGTQISPDWSVAIGKQKEILDAYRAIFGG